MTASDTTFRLIKSLTKSEKRYFRLFSSLTAGNKNYLLIFDEIEKCRDYDEAAVKLALKKRRQLRHFAYEKQYLQHMILKALRNYDSGGDLENFNAMADIEILAKKGLTDMAGKVIRKYKRRAQQFENLPEYIVFARSEMRLASSRQDTLWFADYVQHGYPEDAGLIDQWKYSVFIITRFNELSILSGKYKFVSNAALRRELAGIMRDPMWNGLYQRLGIKGRIAWYNFFTRYYLLLKDYEKAYKNSFEQIRFLEQSDIHFETLGFFNYPVTLINHIETAGILDKYEEVQQYCTQLYTVITGSAYDSVQQIRNQFIITYIVANTVNLTLWQKFSECLRFYNSNKDLLENLKNLTGTDVMITLNYYLALCNFWLRDYDTALEHLDIVLEYRKDEHYATQSLPARVLYIMIHLALGNTEFILNYLRTFKRYFEAEAVNPKTIQAITVIFREYIYLQLEGKNGKEASPLWLRSLQQLKKDTGDRLFIRNTTLEQWIMTSQKEQ